MAKTAAWLRREWSDGSGATLVEYAMLLALVAMVAILAMQFVGGSVSNSLNSSGSSLFR